MATRGGRSDDGGRRAPPLSPPLTCQRTCRVGVGLPRRTPRQSRVQQTLRARVPHDRRMSNPRPARSRTQDLSRTPSPVNRSRRFPGCEGVLPVVERETRHALWGGVAYSVRRVLHPRRTPTFGGRAAPTAQWAERDRAGFVGCGMQAAWLYAASPGSPMEGRAGYSEPVVDRHSSSGQRLRALPGPSAAGPRLPEACRGTERVGGPAARGHRLAMTLDGGKGRDASASEGPALLRPPRQGISGLRGLRSLPRSSRGSGSMTMPICVRLALFRFPPVCSVNHCSEKSQGV